MSSSPPDSPSTPIVRARAGGSEVPYVELEDDDMDYEPASETTVETTTDDDDWQPDDDDDDDEGDDDEVDAEFQDAVENLGPEGTIQLAELLAEDMTSPDTVDGNNDEESESGTAAGAGIGGTRPIAAPITITRNDILQLLSRTARFRSWNQAARTRHRTIADDDDSEDQDMSFIGARRRRRQRDPNVFPKVPSDEGRKLMESGVFGINERQRGQFERKNKLAARLMRRELGLESPGKERICNRLVSQGLIPSSTADKIVHYDYRCYSGQFSDDGNFFFSCSQDFRVRMYDTSNPYEWRHYRTVEYPYGQWTITDASLSPDNKHLAYSSIRSIVCLAPTDPDETQNGRNPYLLDFSDMTRRGYSHFGIWSIRFSGDGREIVAGTSDNSVYVYDIEARQSILRISGHDDDVNAVCFGDKSSPHILYSGSDDTTLKVWDRRSLGDRREAGVFLGHTEGLTYVDSKGDGRYVLSNGKDQTMKLWDLRNMMSTERASKVDLARYSTGFDYRFQSYDDDDYVPHPHDCSLVTFRGHKVLKTLIRCHFSPPGSSDSRYVYTGSEDGSVYIYNLDATIAGKINVERATENTRPRGYEEPDYLYYDDQRGSQRWKTCVRDVSWHPYAPVVAATSWNGYGMCQGTCTIHTWNDGMEDDEAEPRMGQRVDHQLRPNQMYYDNDMDSGLSRRARLRRRMLVGSDLDED